MHMSHDFTGLGDNLKDLFRNYKLRTIFSLFFFWNSMFSDLLDTVKHQNNADSMGV